MSLTTLRHLRRWALRTVTLSLATLTVCIGLLVGVLASPAVAQATGMEIITASKALAEAAPLDITRLALQTAIVAMILLAASVATFFRIWQVQANKPCQLTGPVTHAIIADVVTKAIVEAVRDAKGKA